MAAVVGATVAARLFDADLLDRHLAFCRDAAATLPVRRLRFPRMLSAIPAVEEPLRVELGGGTGGG